MEGYEASTYGDRIAEIYDGLYGVAMDPTRAVDLLAGLAGTGRALELGIGTGRVALPLAERGIDVSGIDASAAMVAKLRDKPGGDRIAVSMGDFADVDVPGTFSLIYIPFTTFFALADQDEQIRCLHGVARHLVPGGHFVMDAFVPDLRRFGSRSEATTTLGSTARQVMLDAMRHDPVRQVIEGHHIIVTEGAITLYPVRVRYCWPSELDVMARPAGLTLEERVEGYDRQPFVATSDRHVSIYGKPATST